MDEALLPRRGILVPPNSEAALLDTLCELLRDPVRSAQWGAVGRARVLEEFTGERFGERLRAAFREAGAPLPMG